MTIHIIFSGSAPDLRFVEIETPEGKGVSIGEWREIDGAQTLVLEVADPTIEQPPEQRRTEGS